MTMHSTGIKMQNLSEDFPSLITWLFVAYDLRSFDLLLQHQKSLVHTF